MGGRTASELVVRSFIDGYFDGAARRSVKAAATRSLEAINRWIHAVGQRDPDLKGMASTLTALILRGRQLHVIHVGDSRLYRLRGDRLQQLTNDHTLGPGNLNRLARAIGADDEVRIDYIDLPNEQHDRYLLCSDGVHGGISDASLREILARRADPGDTARQLVEQAIAARVGDNATALIVDVVDLPPADLSDIEGALSMQAIGDLPDVGAVVDQFRIDEVLSESRYVTVLRATDLVDERQVVMKFPKPLEGADRPMRDAFLRERWIASRIQSPFVGEVIQLHAERQTQLYLAMPFYQGELLESRLRRRPPLSLTAGMDIALKIARGVVAIHRAGVIHRDIKPDNIILCPAVPRQPTAVKIIDFGVARPTTTRDIGAVSEPGTPSYMAPELFKGAQATAESDQFALGVTIYRLFTGRFPYGEIEPFTKPKFRAPPPLSSYRPDLPAWLDRTIGRAIALNPADRYGDVLELVFELENGADRASPLNVVHEPLYQRNPLLFWKVTSIVLALLLALSMYANSGRNTAQPPQPAALKQRH